MRARSRSTASTPAAASASTGLRCSAPSRSAPPPATSLALQLNLGFWPSALLFAAIFAIPAIGWWRLNWNPIFAFWFAYVVTRPLGASFADGFSKPTNGGLNLGDPTVSLIAFVIFVALVAWVDGDQARRAER